MDAEFIHDTCKKVEYLPVVGLMMIFSSLPFGFSSFQKISLFVFGIGFLLDILLNQRWNGWKWSAEKIPYILCILFYLLIPLWHLFESHDQMPNYYVHCLESRMPFILYGLVGFIGLNDKFKIKDFAVVAIITTIIMCVAGLYFFFESIGFRLYAPELTFKQHLDGLMYWTGQKVNVHMTFNLFLNVTVIFIFYLNYAPSIEKWRKWLGNLTFLFFILPEFVLSQGRTGLMTFFILLSFFLFYNLWKRISNKYRIVLSSVIVLVAILLSFHPQFTTKSVSNDPRMAIWNNCKTMIKEHPLLGYGPVSAKVEFIECGKKDADFRNYMQGYSETHPLFDENGNVDMSQVHPHNTYLGCLMEFGIVGLLLFIGCLFSPIFYFKKKTSKLFVSMFVVAYALQAMFESIGPHLLPSIFMIELLVWHYGSDIEEKVQIR